MNIELEEGPNKSSDKGKNEKSYRWTGLGSTITAQQMSDALAVARGWMTPEEVALERGCPINQDTDTIEENQIDDTAESPKIE